MIYGDVDLQSWAKIDQNDDNNQNKEEKSDLDKCLIQKEEKL
jgi:hypothetical protein